MTRRLFALLMPLVLAPLVAVGAAPSAAAAHCNQLAHAYAIHDNVPYFSGYEGNYQLGIQYLVLPRGTAFQVGAAGLLPDSYADFDLYPGDAVPPGWIVSQHLNYLRVGDNCVVNQKWVYPSAEFIGTFQVRVHYRTGRLGTPISETEVFIIFI